MEINTIDAAVAEFRRTIDELGIRLANMASENAELKNKNAKLLKELDSLKPSHEPHP